MSENDRLLARNYAEDDETHTRARAGRVRAVVSVAVLLLLVVGLAVFLTLSEHVGGGIWRGGLPKDPLKAAQIILDSSPVIIYPSSSAPYYANNVSAVDLNSRLPGDVDIPRLREGKVGGFFWSVYVSCPDPKKEGKHFVKPTGRVRHQIRSDTLEQIDVATLLINKYSDTFYPARSAADIRVAISQGKIASLLGVEGAHQLGNSIHVLRQYYALGVRYMTLTHSCNNAFADSGGIFEVVEPVHGGLSHPLGFRLVEEMNRLGVIVDLSHVSDDTARQALAHSKAPVIWSHSSARAVWNISRNVPDDILQRLGTGKGAKDGVVMVNFAPYFVAAPGNATVYAVADHVDHIARVAGKKHVGIGSDFDGIGQVPVGLEDVSKYPNLFAELYKRGWTKFELADLAGGNLLRVFEGVERVKDHLSAMEPVMDLYSRRPDLPMKRWAEDEL